MLVPPTDDSLGFMSDPSKLKNRRFQTQPSNKCDKQAKGAAVDRSWTEAPAEKIARLKREALGAMGPAADPSASNRRKTSASERSNEFGLAGGSEQQQRQRKRVRDQETRQKIEDFNSHQSRGDALYEQSNKKGQRVEEDDPSKRAFDREKDVVGKSISGMQKKDFVKRAAAFGSRFSGGKYL